MASVGHWTVRCRAVAFDGSPDKFCAMAISTAVATSAAQAIWLAQTHRGHIAWKHLPNRALVDWEAAESPGTMPSELSVEET